MKNLFGAHKRPNIQTLKRKGNIEGLIQALNYQDDQNVRREAVWALGQIGDKRAVEPLISCLDDDCLMKELAARSLGEIGDQAALNPLIELLEDDNLDVRGSAAKALGKIGDPRAVKPMIAALRNAKHSEIWFIEHALYSITGLPLSDEPPDWESWLEQNHPGISK